MFSHLEDVEKKYKELDLKLSDPAVLSNQSEVHKYAKEHSDLSLLVECYKEYKKVLQDIEDNKELLYTSSDDEFKELAKEELQILEEKKEKLEEHLKILLLPKDPNDERNVILEIRAGTGGEEAALFASDLFKMYTRYAEKRRWKFEVLSASYTGLGGIKEIIVLIEGKGAYSRLKYESGTHRVQRVPETEAQGRIHTSAVTVAVLPEADEVEVEINPSDLEIDICRAGGAGGQHVNTTDSAIRMVHKPTGLVVICQDERSQHKNKAKALKVLQARLLDMEKRKQHEEIAKNRKIQVGSGDRSERIRTFNFPQGRVTDHRIGLALYRIDSILEGDIDEIIDSLITYFQAESLKGGAV